MAASAAGLPTGDVPDNVLCYRRVDDTRWLRYEPDFGCTRATSGAFQPERLSIALGDTMQALGLLPVDVLAPAPSFALVAFSAGDARALGLEVVRDRQEPTPLDHAHGLVLGRKREREKKGLLRVSTWAIAPVGACQTPAG
jgi:hypothetical protein